MNKEQICDGYQRLIREVFPRAVVRPCKNDWNPYKNESYYAFNIPDAASGQYMDLWFGEEGWGERAEKLGLPQITLMPCYESDAKHYAEKFPEVFGKKSTASTAKKQPSAAKPKRARVVKTEAALTR